MVNELENCFNGELCFTKEKSVAFKAAFAMSHLNQRFAVLAALFMRFCSLRKAVS